METALIVNCSPVRTGATAQIRPLMEAVRSGGEGKYEKTIVCPDGCAILKLTAKPLGNPSFHRGGF